MRQSFLSEGAWAFGFSAARHCKKKRGPQAALFSEGE
jgi:hypothetical protein